MLGLLSVPYTAIPQQEVIVPATQGGIASYATITTDSYLSQALQGMMQNAAGYVGWSLSQWIQAFVQQAQQRCAAYPASCAGTDAETLGTKYGQIAYNLMSTIVSTPNTPQSTPTGGGATVVVVPTPINNTQYHNPPVLPTGVLPTTIETQNGVTSGDLQNVSQNPNVNPNNVNQSVIANSGGTPVAQVPTTPTVPQSASSAAMQSVASGICVDAGNGTWEDTGNGSFCGPSISLNAGVASGICVLSAGGAWVDSGNGSPCTPGTPTTSNVTVGTSSGTDPISELENYSFSLFGMQITGMEAVLGLAGIGILAFAFGGKKGR